MKIPVVFSLLILTCLPAYADFSAESIYTFPSANQELDADLPDSITSGKKSPVWGGVWDESEPSSLEGPLSPLIPEDEIVISPKKTLLEDGDDTDVEKLSDLDTSEVDKLLQEGSELPQKEKNVSSTLDDFASDDFKLDY